MANQQTTTPAAQQPKQPAAVPPSAPQPISPELLGQISGGAQESPNVGW
jgi:hypothetical protein